MANEHDKLDETMERAVEAELKPAPGGVPPRMPLAPNITAEMRTHATDQPRSVAPGYEHLTRILGQAYNQAANGKGRERHGVGFAGFRAWDQQPILELARMTGPGASAYQVMKKAQEACTLATNRNFAAAKAEALGAIVYAAALYKLIEEMEKPNA